MSTYREQFDSAMKCESKQEAEAWMENEVRNYVEEFGTRPEEAFSVIRYNLGYMAGYYGKGAAIKIDVLFGAKHPGYDAFKVIQ